MGLPKIDIPLHNGKILSTGEEIRYRPFTVKEEKILLTAQESKSVKEIFGAIQQVLTNCIPDKDVSKMTLFDVTYLLLQVRAASVNEVIDFKIRDPETEEEVELVLDINQIKLTETDGHTKQLNVGNDMTLLMRYPSFKEMSMLENGNEEELFAIMVSCMDKLVHGDSVYDFSDFSEEEIHEFVESLSKPAFDAIKNFFDTMPVIKVEFKYVNSNGSEKSFVVEGMESFFI